MAKRSARKTVKKATSKTLKKSPAKTLKKRRMKSYETFDLWAADQTPEHQTLIRKLRKLVNKTAPKLNETVKWGNGCWVGKEWPVIFIFAGYEILQFGFFGGSDLLDSDPMQLLKGNGKFIRHIPVPSVQKIHEAAFKKLIKKATRNECE